MRSLRPAGIPLWQGRLGYLPKTDFADVAVITGMKAETEKNVAVLSRALEDANTRLKASQDKVELLSDENKVILQEKAVIQGQFKQFQSSLP